MIHRLMVSQFMGIAAAEYEFSPKGGVLEGGNGRGKTSVLEAIRACLAGQGIGPDAIRLGSDSAEILLDLDDLTVRRAISRSGSTLTVTKDGVRQKAPQAFLTALLGVSPLDPLDLFLAPAKDRQAMILSAIPMTVDERFLSRYLPRLPGVDREDAGAARTQLAQLLGRDAKGDPAIHGHGLEVVDRLRRAVYDQRAAANKELKARAAEEQASLAALATVRQEVSSCSARSEDLSGILQTLAEDRASLGALQERRRQAEAAIARSAGTQARIDDLRARASAFRAEAPLAPTVEAVEAADERIRVAAEAQASALHVVLECEKRLKEARSDEQAAANATRDARLAREDLSVREEAAHKYADKVAELEGQALELAQALGAGGETVSDRELTAAKVAIDALQTLAEAAQEAQALELRAATRRDAAEAALVARVAAESRAHELDQAVKALTEEAPRALLAAADGIPGLALSGDAVTLDGVDLTRLSGAEQMRLSVEVARRLNVRSGLLIVDALERLDNESLIRFEAFATAPSPERPEGYQLIATRVLPEGGPVQLQALGGAS